MEENHVPQEEEHFDNGNNNISEEGVPMSREDFDPDNKVDNPEVIEE